MPQSYTASIKIGDGQLANAIRSAVNDLNMALDAAAEAGLDVRVDKMELLQISGRRSTVITVEIARPIL